jgi:hypothetical protein
MEKVTVTFKGENREIVVNFELNHETADLNYQVQVTPPFADEDEIAKGGLDIYLANMFLGTLQVPGELNDDEVADEN